MFRLALALNRADLDAQFASGAVFRRNLEGISEIFELAPGRLFLFLNDRGTTEK